MLDIHPPQFASSPAFHVDLMHHRFKVGRANAVSDTTEMIQFMTGRDRSIDALVGPHMDPDYRSSVSGLDSGISSRTSGPGRPEPAVSEVRSKSRPRSVSIDLAPYSLLKSHGVRGSEHDAGSEIPSLPNPGVVAGAIGPFGSIVSALGDFTRSRRVISPFPTRRTSQRVAITMVPAPVESTETKPYRRVITFFHETWWPRHVVTLADESGQELSHG